MEVVAKVVAKSLVVDYFSVESGAAMNRRRVTMML